MKKTQVIELFKNIQHSFVSFLSITIFVVLGVGIFLGLSWTGGSIRNELDNTLRENNYHDIEASFPYGVSKEEIDSLKKLDGIDEVDGGFECYETFKIDDELYQGRIVSLTNTLDTVYDIQGRLPSAYNEIVIDKGDLKHFDLEIGDTITFDAEDATSFYLLNNIDLDNIELDSLANQLKEKKTYLKTNEFTIVGIVQNPDFISISMSSYGLSTSTGLQVNLVCYVDYSAFNEEVIKGYNTVLLKSNALNDLDIYSDEYIEKVNELKNNIQDQLVALSNQSYLRAKSIADGLILKVDEKLQDSKKQIEEGNAKIEKGKLEIAKNDKKLKEALLQTNAAKPQLDEAKMQLDAAWGEIQEGDGKHSEAKSIYERAKDNFEIFKELYGNISTSINTVFDKVSQALVTSDTRYMKEELVGDLMNLLVESDVEKLDSLESLNDFNLSEDYSDDVHAICNQFFGYTLNATRDYFNVIASEKFNDYISIYNRYDNHEITAIRAYFELKQLDAWEHLKNIFYEEYSDASKDAIKNITLGYIGDLKYLLNGDIKDFYDVFVVDVNQQLFETKEQIDDSSQDILDATYLWSVNNNLYIEQLNQYNNAVKQIEQGKVQIAQARIDLENAQKELQEASERVLEGEKQYAELLEVSPLVKDYGTSITTKEECTAKAYNELLSDIILKAKWTLGGIFLMIGIMICYSVVKRLVMGQIRQIGTKKANGFYRKEITLSFLAYSALTLLIGSVLGFVVAHYGIQPIMTKSITMSMTIDVKPTFYDTKELLLLCGIEFVLIEIMTLVACQDVLKQDTVKLLQGSMMIDGKERFYEKWKCWNRLSLWYKTILNNFFNDKKRIYATLVGIAGCTVLVVCAITMKENIAYSFNKQYSDYYHFDNYIYYDNSVIDAKENIEKILDENNIPHTDLYHSTGYVQIKDTKREIVTLMVFNDLDSAKELFEFESTDEQNKNQYIGTWLPESLQKAYQLHNNEKITYTGLGGEEASFELTGFYKLYSYYLTLYMDAGSYQNIYGALPESNLIIINNHLQDTSALNEQLKSVNGYMKMFDFYSYSKTDLDVFNLVANVIVGVYLTVSIVMAIFVLLNLFVTTVEEKRREVITLMINGYSLKQAKRYIYLDNLGLALAGILLGNVIGIICGDFTIASFESKFMYMYHRIAVNACLIGTLSTAILVYIMTMIALSRIKNFSLTEINKA